MVSLRSLSELESIKLGGETSDKIRQVTERATLFRITSNAMINVRRFSTSTSCLRVLRCGVHDHTIHFLPKK